MKKLLCTLLAVAMLVSMMALAVMATDETAAPEEGPTVFPYPELTGPESLPTRSAGPGLVAAVLLKPDDDLTASDGSGAGLYSRVRFIFTAENNMNGYNCHWGLGYINPDSGEPVFNMGSANGHYLGSKYNYDNPGGVEVFRWDNDADGFRYFELVIVNHPNANGKWVDGEGNEYNTMYEQAAAGQLMATYGEHEDPNGPGYPNGYINNDNSHPNVNMFGTTVNPFGTYDAITVRVLTEEEYYEGGDRNNKSKAEFATLATVVAHVYDGTVKTLDGKNSGKLSFVFKNWVGNGYNCTWGVALIPKGEDGKRVDRPATLEGYKWYNCNKDEDVIYNGNRINTSWSHESFVWGTDENGDTTFTVIFQIPQAEIEAAGYKSMEDAAFNGGLIGYIAQHEGAAGDGYMNSDPDKGQFYANATLANGMEAVVVGAVSGADYYGEIEYVESGDTDPIVTDPVDTDPVDTDKTETGAPAGTTEGTEKPEEEKKGCGSAIGVGALVLAVMAAAPVAFARKKD